MADLLIDAIESFIITLDKERNFSLHTIKAYKNDLNRFNSFLNQGISRIILKKINRNDIRKFLSDEYDNNFTSKTVARRLATIKSFFKYLVKIELIEENIAIHINSPKVAKRLPSFINKSLIDVLMNSPSLDTLIGVRDRAVLELFYSTGMRLSELVNINIGDFHLNNKLLRVIGKGKKERMIPYGRAAESAIENYLKMVVEIFPLEYQEKLIKLLRYASKNMNSIHTKSLSKSVFSDCSVEHLIYWHAISKLLLTDKGTWRKQFDKRNGFPANGKKEKTEIKNLVEKLQQIELQEKRHQKLSNY